MQRGRSENTTKVFVGSLPAGATPDDLRKLFEPYGTIAECDISNKCGFLHLEDRDLAMKAISELNGTDFMGSRISVEKGRVKPRRGGGGGPMRGGRGDRGGPYSRGGGRDFRGGPRGGGFGGRGEGVLVEEEEQERQEVLVDMMIDEEVVVVMKIEAMILMVDLELLAMMIEEHMGMDQGELVAMMIEGLDRLAEDLLEVICTVEGMQHLNQWEVPHLVTIDMAAVPMAMAPVVEATEVVLAAEATEVALAAEATGVALAAEVTEVALVLVVMELLQEDMEAELAPVGTEVAHLLVAMEAVTVLVALQREDMEIVGPLVMAAVLMVVMVRLMQWVTMMVMVAQHHEVGEVVMNPPIHRYRLKEATEAAAAVAQAEAGPEDVIKLSVRFPKDRLISKRFFTHYKYKSVAYFQ